MIRVFPLILSALLGQDCEVFDSRLRACDYDDDASFEPTVTVETVVVEPVAEGLRLEGTLESNVRVGQFRIHDRTVKGTSDNYRNWEIELPQPTLVGARGDDGMARLSVDLEDTCGRVYEHQSVDVPVVAPSSAKPMGEPSVVLELLFEQPGGQEISTCYIPANGETLVRAVASTDSRHDANLAVAFTPTLGTLVGSTEPRLLRITEEKAMVTADLQVPQGAAGVLRVLATFGSLSVLSRSLRVAGAPAFSGNQETVEAGTDAFLAVSTDGELRTCSASASIPGVTVELFDGNGAIDLLNPASQIALLDGQCGDLFGIRVSMPDQAPTGAVVMLRCEDAYGQVGQRLMIATAQQDEDASVASD